MATLPIEIPDTKIPVLKKALGYQDTIPVLDAEGLDLLRDENGDVVTEPNPVTATEHAQKIIIDFLKGKVREYEKREAIKNLTYTDITK